jgi:hypothetical protein
VSRDSTTVKCTSCGWRGRRVWRECWCEDYCMCARYGDCPRCGVRVDSVSDLREIAKRQAETDAFFATPEGRALLNPPQASGSPSSEEPTP